MRKTAKRNVFRTLKDTLIIYHTTQPIATPQVKTFQEKILYNKKSGSNLSRDDRLKAGWCEGCPLTFSPERLKTESLVAGARQDEKRK
jgi:hypothetical protein